MQLTIPTIMRYAETVFGDAVVINRTGGRHAPRRAGGIVSDPRRPDSVREIRVRQIRVRQVRVRQVRVGHVRVRSPAGYDRAGRAGASRPHELVERMTT